MEKYHRIHMKALSEEAKEDFAKNANIALEAIRHHNAVFIFNNPLVLYNARYVVKLEISASGPSLDTDELQERIAGLNIQR